MQPYCVTNHPKGHKKDKTNGELQIIGQHTNPKWWFITCMDLNTEYSIDIVHFVLVELKL